METVVFDGTKIALIVRGKTGAGHEPDIMAQHADAILSDGSPIGFFGEGDGISGSGGSIGFGMDGVVYDYHLMKAHRPYYVDLDQAKRYGVKSTVLVLKVTSEIGLVFDEFWSKLKLNPGNFSLLGDNCATHGSEAFMKAGIVNRGIPGLDTPDNLYKQLIAVSSKTESYSGHVGFVRKASGGGFDLVID